MVGPEVHEPYNDPASAILIRTYTEQISWLLILGNSHMIWPPKVRSLKSEAAHFFGSGTGLLPPPAELPAKGFPMGPVCNPLPS